VLAELDEMADRAVVVARGRTVAVEVLGAGPATWVPDGGSAGPAAPDGVAQRVGSRGWRIRALDLAALQSALHAFERRAEPAGRDTVEVQVASDADAAELLARLVAEGVPVVAFQPAAGALEEAYMALTEDRR
jgi:ABC-2 type transport system ATP-binding protein